MQNPYNNYLKRQKQQPINNFKEKVKNSLSGKVINNTTTPNTSNPIANKLSANMNMATQGSTSQPKSVQPINNTNTQETITTPPVANTTPQNTTTTTPQVSDVPTTSGAGLMSLSDINNAISTPTTNPNARTTVTYNPLDPNAIVPGTGGMTQAEYEAEVKRKQEAGIALDNQELYNKYVNASTPYKYAEQILQSQKEQADKNWQLQEQMFNQQQQNLKDQYNQSVKDAENAYNKSVDTLNEQRYNQMEDLNVSGTSRGIQYSPQQLGLENVANINHNKNLAEASNARNELLNKLQIEMNNSLAQLNMSHLQSYNSYQENIMKYQTDYYNQLMNWNREDSQTQSERDWEQKLLEEKRKWEEEQALKDKEFEQMMQELQNKFDKEMQDSQNNWQSGENALDREHETNLNNSRSSGGYSGYSGYSGGGYSRSYTPYSRNYYNGYGGYDDTLNLDDEITQQAIDNNFKRLSTDAYNAVDTGGVGDLYERADLYNEYISGIYDQYYGLNDVTDERLDNTRSTALKHLLNKSYARSTNGTYQIGDTVYTHNSPLRQDFIDKVKKTQAQNREKYYSKYKIKRDELTKSKMKTNARAENIHNKIMDNANKNKTSNKSDSKNTSTRNTNVKETQKKVTKAVDNATKNVKKSTSNAAKNIKKNTNTKTNSSKTQKAVNNSNKNTTKSLNNAKKNVAKSTSNAKKNTKKSTNNALKNLKKNISKLFGK